LIFFAPDAPPGQAPLGDHPTTKSDSDRFRAP
jgi:hypothetical protein